MILPKKVVSVFTPKYFIVSVRYSLLPHNLIFKSSSNFFCLDLKITISVIFTLSEMFVKKKNLHLTNLLDASNQH